MKKLISVFALALALGSVLSHAGQIPPPSAIHVVDQYKFNGGNSKLARSLAGYKADSCEERCYKQRRSCQDSGGDSKTCDPQYDRCKKRCN